MDRASTQTLGREHTGLPGHGERGHEALSVRYRTPSEHLRTQRDKMYHNHLLRNAKRRMPALQADMRHAHLL